MTIAEDVEPRARELGVWTLSAHRRDGLCMRGEPSGFQVCEGGDKFKMWIDLTAPEAALFLRCVASGLAVELPCSDCEGAKVKRRRDLLGDLHNAADGWGELDGWVPLSGPLEFGYHRTWLRPCPTCSEPTECDCPPSAWGPEGDCYACGNTGKVDGVPTGRETVGLAAAWLRGRPVEVLGYGRGTDIDEAKADALWEIEALGADPSKALEKDRPFRDGDMLAVTYAAPGPGDPSTREALMVLADKRQSEGDPLGELLALDLAGAACPAGCSGWSIECDACEGHGTALAQRQRAIGTTAHPAASLTTAASA